jgi:hypothetical protein
VSPEEEVVILRARIAAALAVPHDDTQGWFEAICAMRHALTEGTE